MRKIILVLVIVCAVLSVGALIYSLVGKKKAEPAATTAADSSFGSATLALVDSGKYQLACEDAKSLTVMISDINKDFADNPNLSTEVTPENMTPAMKKFESTMDIFGKQLETKFGKDKTAMEEVFQGIGEGVSNVFQVSIMTHLGMIAKEKLDEYVNVTYCGAAPSEGYVSPLEMDMESLNIPADEGSPAAPVAPETPVK